MENGAMMGGKTHMTTGTATNTHMMGSGNTMSGSAHVEGDTHTMNDGSHMDGAIHIEWDSHIMIDGSNMNWATHMDDGTESQ